MKSQIFQGYKWQNHEITKAESFLASIKWDALCLHASSLNTNESCTLDPQIAKGGRNLVRILNFSTGVRWIARLRLPPINEKANILLQQEVDCIKLVRERTNVPVPAIYGYIASADLIGAPFILMESLQGNAAIDLNDRRIPSEHKSSFYNSLTEYQAEISSITFPKIGSVVRRPDGTYDVGPLPKLGGPFSTATEYLQAWAQKTPFYGGIDGLKDDCGIYYEEILQGVLEFPQRLSELAGNFTFRNNGPFPLIHPDFNHNNIIVDDDWKVLGVIDWEFAHSAPWEIVEFPITLSMCPRPLDAPWNYDESGVATDEELRTTIKERKEFVEMVRQFEKRKGKLTLLSDVLNDQASQDLASAIRNFTIVGKRGWYNKIIDTHKERWGLVS